MYYTKKIPNYKLPYPLKNLSRKNWSTQQKSVDTEKFYKNRSRKREQKYIKLVRDTQYNDKLQFLLRKSEIKNIDKHMNKSLMNEKQKNIMHRKSRSQCEKQIEYSVIKLRKKQQGYNSNIQRGQQLNNKLNKTIQNKVSKQDINGFMKINSYRLIRFQDVNPQQHIYKKIFNIKKKKSSNNEYKKIQNKKEQQYQKMNEFIFSNNIKMHLNYILSKRQIKQYKNKY